MRLRLPSPTMLPAAAACAAALALLPAGAADASAKPGFVPGTWSGGGTTNGTFTLGGTSSPVSGDLKIKLAISKDLKASGTMAISSTMTTSIEDLRGKVKGAGTLKLSGTSTKVHYSGTLPMRGVMTDGVLTVPFGMPVALSGDLVITKAGCAKVAGKTNQRFPLRWSVQRKGGGPAGCR